MKLFAAALSLTLSLLTFQVQSPAPPVPPRGRIEGTVLRNIGNEPLRGARVSLTRINASTGNAINVVGNGTSYSITNAGAATPTPGFALRGAGTAAAVPLPATPPLSPDVLPIPPILTDNNGRFSFMELEAGSYRLSISSNGYVRQEYGQRIFPGQGTLLNLAAGQAMRDLVVHLTQAGNINGRITDNMGEFAVGTTVYLLKVAYNAIGQKTFQDAGTARTNDRGEYRLYWVTPGRYFIAAGIPPGPTNNSYSNPNESTDRYSFTFFPGVADVTRASSIDVQSGSEAAADFSVPRQELYHVRGRVTDATGRPPSSISVSFALQNVAGQSAAFGMGQSYDSTTGNFDVPNVMPGSYILQVASTTVERVMIEVVNSNVDNLSFVVGSGAVLTGRIHTDSVTSPMSPGVLGTRVQLRGLNMGVVVSHPGVETDGGFRIENVTSADYRVVVSNLPTELYAKEVRLGGLDLMYQTLHVAPGAPIAGTVDVVLSTNVSQIDGAVLDDRGQPIPGIQAVLVPDRNRDHTELFKTATTDQTGHYSIRGIPPGDYKLFAWESLESFGYFDPELLRQSELQGKPLHISESSKLNQDIRSIR